MEFVNDSLGNNYPNISKHELQILFDICNNHNDLEGSYRVINEGIIKQYNKYIESTRLIIMLVNSSKIKKFKDLCDEDIINKHLVEHASQIFSNLRKYILPTFIVLGLLGNCLSAIVLFRKKMRFFSINIYLGVLAICDFGYSMMLLIDWLSIMTIVSEENYLYWSIFFSTYLRYFFQFMSVWLIVTVTINRYIATKYSFLCRSWCTVKQAKIVVIMLMGLAILYSIAQNFIAFGFIHIYKLINKEEINIFDVYKQLQSDFWKEVPQARKIIDSIIIFTLPALVIVICNTLIGYHIYQQNRVYKAMITASNTANDSTQISSDINKLQHNIIKLLVLVSSTFLIWKLPEHYFVYFLKDILKNTSMLYMRIIFYLLDTAYYCINFVLYCVQGQTFHRELISMFTKRINIRRNIIEMDNYKY